MNRVLLLDAQRTVFSVYRVKNAVVLRKGDEDWRNARLISTYKSYEAAREFAALIAERHNLPLRDLTRDRT
jgi:hypothetical protein